jgi:deoxyribodipyrimidine photolyase-related protein
VTRRRWLFADQLGPHFLDHPILDAAGADEPVADEVGHGALQPVLLVVSRRAFHRGPIHRRKAHLLLSALLHRAAELGERASLVEADTYRDAVIALGEPLEVVGPTSRAAVGLVESLPDVTVLPPRGFAASGEAFTAWATGRRQLRLEDFYREQRRRLGLLLEPDGTPTGGTWNLDAENRQPPPRGAHRLGDATTIPDPWWPTEDDLDAEARALLDRWVRDDGLVLLGADGPRRFAVTAAEATAAADHFLDHRLGAFGPYEDAMLADDRWMAHSLLSVPLNLGLLDPVELARAAEARYRAGAAPLASVEGFIRQVVGWRDYVWHLYWRGGPSYAASNVLEARTPLPHWWEALDADAVTARCLGGVLRDLHDEGWVHHIPRLMVLGSWALQHGLDPQALTDWFRRAFVDGYDWVMVPNVVGMSQWADGGVMATKPYTSGGAYLHKMSDYCGGCRYSPTVRAGPTACPFTAGYWAFLARHREQLAGNHRLRTVLGGLDRLQDLPAVLAQEQARGTAAP